MERRSNRRGEAFSPINSGKKQKSTFERTKVLAEPYSWKRSGQSNEYMEPERQYYVSDMQQRSKIISKGWRPTAKRERTPLPLTLNYSTFLETKLRDQRSSGPRGPNIMSLVEPEAPKPFRYIKPVTTFITKKEMKKRATQAKIPTKKSEPNPWYEPKPLRGFRPSSSSPTMWRHTSASPDLFQPVKTLAGDDYGRRMMLQSADGPRILPSGATIPKKAGGQLAAAFGQRPSTVPTPFKYTSFTSGSLFSNITACSIDADADPYVLTEKSLPRSPQGYRVTGSGWKPAAKPAFR